MMVRGGQTKKRGLVIPPLLGMLCGGFRCLIHQSRSEAQAARQSGTGNWTRHRSRWHGRCLRRWSHRTPAVRGSVRNTASLPYNPLQLAVYADLGRVGAADRAQSDRIRLVVRQNDPVSLPRPHQRVWSLTLHA